MSGNPDYKHPRGRKGARANALSSHSYKHSDFVVDLGKQQHIRRMLPNAFHEIEHADRLPDKKPPYGRSICDNCGHQSTKQLPDGSCPDKGACARRRETWE